jgi:hypothetical protein
VKAQTIKFEDGYTVTLDERACVTINHNGKSNCAHSTHWTGVPADSKAAEHLLKNGKNLADYLWCKPSTQEQILRAGNGVREAVQAAAVESNRLAQEEERTREEQRAKDLAGAAAASGLKNPVPVRVDYFDGYQTHINHDGRELHDVDWSKVTLGEFSFIEADALQAAIQKHDQKKAADQQVKASAESARKAEFAAKLAEAQRTNKPVTLATWVTDHCMNHHDDECSFDSAVKSVLPDGTTKTTYTCCY